MRGRSLRRYVRDVLLIAAVVAIGSLSLVTILGEQGFRIPLLQERPFELKAAFRSAQAVVPGQGQTIRVAGVRIGEVDDVELVEGQAVVTFAIEDDHLPIHRDATVLMRPTSALKDMFFELDPGSPKAGAYEEGETIPATQTSPDVNLDEILGSLDGDTRAYLRMALAAGGEGLAGNDRRLGRLLGGLGPMNARLARLNGQLERRQAHLRDLVTSLRRVGLAVGSARDDLAALVAAGDSALSAVAENAPDLTRTIAALPGTLSAARTTLDDLGRMASVLGPASAALRPSAAELPEVSSALRRVADHTTPAIRGEIRPFVRSARRIAPPLTSFGREYSRATPGLTAATNKLNRLANMAAYNPRGAEAPGAEGRDEGYLYWIAWMIHNGVSIFGGEDGNGLYRRFLLTASCPVLANTLSVNPLAPLLTDVDLLFAPGGACS